GLLRSADRYCNCLADFAGSSHPKERCMPLTLWIHEFLHEVGAAYSVIPHRPAYTAQDEAAATHVPGREFAKVVICFIDDQPVQAVVPATLSVNVDRLLNLAG